MATPAKPFTAPDRLARAAVGLDGWWARHRRAVLVVLIVATAIEASAYLGYELWRLLLEHGWMGATDLGHRLRETHSWFAGRPVYGALKGAVYPPATYVLLWPFVGWLGLGSARWLWAIPTLAGLSLLVLLVLRHTRPNTSLERAAIVLVLLAMYPTGQLIGNGQLLLAALPLLLAALLLLQRRSEGWLADLLVALLLLAAMVKVTAVVPFLVLAAIAPWRKRPLVLALCAYAGVTIVAAAFQHPGLIGLLRDWSKAASSLDSARGTASDANAQAWLSAVGLKQLVVPVAVVIVTAFGAWAWRHRRVDPWLLIGVAGYVSRLWTYHRSYDDILIVLPMIALLRIARNRSETRPRAVAAGVLLAATVVLILVPGGPFGLPGPLRSPFAGLEAVVWLAGLAFLLLQARVPVKADCPEVAATSPAGDLENMAPWTSSNA